MKSYVLAALLIVASAGSSQSEAYFCSGEVSGGLQYADKGWQAVTFNLKGDQFTVSNTPSDPRVYTVKGMGEDTVKFRCNRGEYAGVLNDQMTCGGLAWGMIINLKVLRYTEIYTIGYIQNDTAKRNTPSITAGKCTKID